MRRILTGLSLVAALAACGPSYDGLGGATTGQTFGTIGGAVGGGLLGSQIGSGTGQLAATAAGTALGALLGGQFGQRLDANDRRVAAQAQTQALASNTVTNWSNPGSNISGTVTPLRAYQMDGRFCREYVHTVYIGGRAEEARGTACQLADGSWQIVG